ncbi:hypothetical protein DL240_01245 [Lujinxingia litoralis]|uniref:Uncharacterized protein n=1 Tax=Lujinxingia litoralis TaxID=2211119 RepID=A0A328CAP7_9DELT|nr:pilus assembly protein TadG-related protein [Lujinxingia litoralis]RAL24864.1 hypothetical protein DL240_01245 [Lujinxingia litoralis]
MSLLRNTFRQRLAALHRAQQGAVFLLMLAGILMVFISAMMMHDAGDAARDKIELQNAADTAAFSQSVVKARSMNMISYANTAKRVFYGYTVVYFNAYQALITSLAIYTADCLKIFPNPHSCYRMAVGGVQLAMETLELGITNLPTMLGRSNDEIKTLDFYQQYMRDITPWWSYVENVMRGISNGATVTGAWPPPPGDVVKIPDQITSALSFIDNWIGTSIVEDYVPEHTDKTDKLPIKRHDDSLGTIMAHAGYCTEFIATPEHLMLAAEHIIRSDSGIKGISKDGQTIAIFIGLNIVPAIGCTIAGFMHGAEVLDYRVDNGVIDGIFNGVEKNTWMQSTSNITFAYQAGGKRSGIQRNRFNILGGDHNSAPFYAAEGYWSMARSEIVFGETTLSSSLGGVFNTFNPFNGVVGGLIGRPHMWSPSWTARLRPVHLPGENLGTSFQGNPVGMKAVYMDMVPYLALTSLVGLLDSNFSLGSAVKDFMYLYAVNASMNADRLQGIQK